MGTLFGKANFTFVRGTEWADDFTLVDQTTGTPISLVGVTGLIMRFREDYGTAILLELTSAAGDLVILNAATGAVGIRVSGDANRAAFPENDHAKAKYLYDALIERTPGTWEPAAAGKVTVLPQVTRPWGAT